MSSGPMRSNLVRPLDRSPGSGHGWRKPVRLSDRFFASAPGGRRPRGTEWSFAHAPSRVPSSWHAFLGPCGERRVRWSDRFGEGAPGTRRQPWSFWRPPEFTHVTRCRASRRAVRLSDRFFAIAPGGRLLPVALPLRSLARAGRGCFRQPLGRRGWIRWRGTALLAGRAVGFLPRLGAPVCGGLGLPGAGLRLPR